ncbi:hypothetical protein BGZ75_009524 [Mortierella antarctica]|nr:hypothetical protein BGZ75_009524 [Mortierella antarctica]
MSPTNMISPQVALHVYTDFDSTVVLEDTGNTLLEHEIGAKELERLDRLPETNPGHISLRKAEDMKWDKLRLTVQEAADILVGPLDGQQTPSRKPFDQTDDSIGTTRSYRVRLDPAFKEFHRYCKEHHIPITVVSIGIQPLIVEILNRYLGVDHGIEVRANGLTVCPDGSWKIVWRDSSPFGVEKGRALREARANDLLNPTSDQILWCGDGSSDFPAALVADIRLARQNTTLEKLLRANQIPHRAFTTFRTVQETVEDWLREHPERPSAGSLSDMNEP